MRINLHIFLKVDETKIKQNESLKRDETWKEDSRGPDAVDVGGTCVNYKVYRME